MASDASGHSGQPGVAAFLCGIQEKDSFRSALRYGEVLPARWSLPELVEQARAERARSGEPGHRASLQD